MTDLVRMVTIVGTLCERILPLPPPRRGRPATHATTLILQLAAVQ